MRGTMKMAAAVLLGACGCATQPVSIGPAGLNGEHVRAAAQALCASLAQSEAIVGQVARTGRPVCIRMADVENTSRFMIDENIFLKRLRAELNAGRGNPMRFLDSSGSVNEERTKIQRERQRQSLLRELRQIAGYIARSAEVRGRQVTVAVVPALNAHLVGMNADGFLTLLREELVAASGGALHFLAPGEVEGAEYLLTGEFYALDSAETVRLNVMLTKPVSGKTVFECGAQVCRAVSDGAASADFILSGEISGLASRRTGVSSDYVLLSFKLVDPERNTLVWEGAYEVEFVSREGIVYQ